MIAFIVGALLADTAPAQSLRQPSGPWSVDYSRGCMLSRDFNNEEGPAVIRLRTMPLTQQYEIYLQLPTTSSGKSTGSMKVAFSGSGQLDSYYIRRHHWFGKSSAAYIKTVVPSRDVDAIAAPASVTFTVDGGQSVGFALPKWEGARRALATCQEAILRGWQVDPQVVAKVKTPPEPIVGDTAWVGTADYPASAIRASEEGDTIVLLDVTADGSIAGCRTVVSSNSDALDAAACSATQRRGRFRPGLDADDRPVPAMVARWIRWRLPVDEELSVRSQ